jgi:holo-[acyl-carrier protein] synthase
VGLDIVEISRVARLCRDRRFVERVFTPGEVRYCRGRKASSQHFAVRFSAKEAVFKALGERGLSFLDVEVENAPSGEPKIRIRGVERPDVRVSLSHCRAYAAAAAFVVRP